MILMLIMIDAPVISCLHDHYMMCIICGDEYLVVLFMVFSATIYKFIMHFFLSLLLFCWNFIILLMHEYMQANGAEDKVLGS